MQHTQLWNIMVLKVTIDFSFIEENIIPLFEADEHNLSKFIGMNNGIE